MFPKTGHTLGMVDVPEKHFTAGLQLAISLLGMFDFQGRGTVSHEDWLRGVDAIGIDAVKDPEIWTKMASLYDTTASGFIELSAVKFVVPLDPMVGMLMGAVVKSLGDMKQELRCIRQKAGATKEVAVDRVILNMRRRILHPAFLAWMEMLRRRRVRMHKMSKCARRLAQRDTAKAWDQWSEVCTEGARLRKFAQRMRRGGEVRAVASWAAFVEQRQRLQRMMKRGLNGQLARALDVWLEQYEAGAEQMGRLRKFGARFAKAELYRAWAVLAEAGAERRRLKKIARKALNRDTARGLAAWSDFLEERRRLQRFMRRMMNAGVARAWEAWLESNAERARLQRFGRRLANREVGKAWNAWQERIEEQLRLRRIASRAMNRGLSIAWATWMELLSGRAKQAKVLRRIAMAGQLRAFNCWLGMLEERRRLQRFMRRAMNSGAARALTQWLDYMDDAKRLQRFGRRLANREVGKAWNAWQERIEEQLRLRQAASRVLNPGLSRAWSAWEHMCGSLHERRVLMQRVLNSSVLRACNHWAEVVDERRRLQRFMRRVLNSGVARAWEAWLEAAESSRRLRRFGRRMRNNHVGRAFNAWCGRAEENDAIRRKAARMLNPALSRALSAWVDAYEERLRLMQLARRALNTDTLRALNAWVEMVEERRRVARYLRRALNSSLTFAWLTWLELLAHLGKLRKFGKRLTARGLGMAWQSWQDACDQGRRSRKLLARVVNSGAVRAINHWVDVAYQMRRLQRFFRRLKNHNVARAFSEWIESAEEMHAQRQQARRALQTILNGVLVRTFKGWAEVAREAAEERRDADERGEAQARLDEERLRKARNRMGHRLESLVFERWHKLASESRALRAKGFARWRNAEVAKGFYKWSDFAVEHARMVHLGKQLLGKYLHGLCARVFALWASAVSGKQERRAFVERQVLSMMSSRAELMLDYVFAGWRSMSEERRQRVRELAGKAIGRYRNALVASCFLPWAAVAARANDHKRRKLRWLAIYLSGDVSFVARLCLEAWGEFAAGKRNKRNAIVREALGKARLGLVQTMFVGWRDFTQSASAEKAAADAYESERNGVDVKSDVVDLRRQLALTRKELAQVSASTAWRYELAVVRNELRHAIKVIAMHADGLFAADGGGSTAAERAEWLADGGGAEAAFSDAAGLPGVSIAPPKDVGAAWSDRAAAGALPGGIPPSPYADDAVDETLRLPDSHYYTTPTQQPTRQSMRHQTYPMRPGARPGSAGRGGDEKAAWASDKAATASSGGAAVPVFGVVGIARAEPTRHRPRPPSAPAARGPTLAARMQSPRVRGLATAHEITAHVTQRLYREGDRLGLDRTPSEALPWSPRASPAGLA